MSSIKQERVTAKDLDGEIRRVERRIDNQIRYVNTPPPCV